MLVLFDTLNIYYLPQYNPISQELIKRGHDVAYVVYLNRNEKVSVAPFFEAENAKVYWVKNSEAAVALYRELKADWVVFGNTFEFMPEVNLMSNTAQLGHGIGPKPGYYKKSNTPTTIRFIEGKLRVQIAQSMYPDCPMVQVGFSKMDPLFQGKCEGLDLLSLGLDDTKQTIVYAPTFNPSSIELFPDRWPEDFADFNILIKPHSITQTRSRYWRQQEKIRKWSSFPNVYVADENEISILPYLKTANILLSEASSTLFEFVALDKPVIVCNFFKLKWTYRGIFRFRFEKRFGQDGVVFKDIGVHVDSYKLLRGAVEQQLENPGQFREARRQYTEDHVGPTDGLASKRIVDYVEENLNA